MSGPGGGQSFRLRDAGAQDVAALAQILGDWCRDTPWMPKLHTRDEDLWFVAELLRTHVVRVGQITRPDTAVGLGFLARQGGEVAALYIDPSARGRGLGKALLDEAKGQGTLGLWTFQANTGARKFYAREGFREIRYTDGANDEGLPDVWMEWRA